MNQVVQAEPSQWCRQGHSPGVPFPRILGIEAVGIVEDAPGTEFAKGDIVATAMGGMGRQFTGDTLSTPSSLRRKSR